MTEVAIVHNCRNLKHGWVAPLDPLTPGTHTIVGTGSAFSFTTKIIVASGG